MLPRFNHILHHRPILKLLSQLAIFSALAALSVGSFFIAQAQTTNARGEPPTECPNEQPINVPNVEKKLIQINTNLSRFNQCITPDLIFIHATNGGTLDSNWAYFNSGSEGNQTNAQFIVGTNGKIYQTVELYQSVAEFAITNNPYNNRSIGIEMVHDDLEYADRNAIPEEQYQATLQLVRFLMNQYNIPLSSHQSDWTAPNCNPTTDFTSGVYSHYQICPGGPAGHSDIGQDAFTRFLEDLQSSTTATSTSSGGGGRIVPYDKYARPYSWPVAGKIIQDYGFTELAQSLGKRFPGIYPIGDPNVVFSTTNHTEPPIDPLLSKFINPNIDIAPDDTTAHGRAVYATHAGWLTFADWAGPQKGYTIQIESDVEGDGQADLATRYMRLQAPQNGYFAPDIPIFHPSTSQTSPTNNGQCTSPASNEWQSVNKWDQQIQQGLETINQQEEVKISCNLAKSLLKILSNGVDLGLDDSGRQGLFQIPINQGDSNCDRRQFDINSPQGNINCGLQDLARSYKACQNSWDQAVIRFASGSCNGNDKPTFIKQLTPSAVLSQVQEYNQYLDSDLAKSAPPAIDDQPNPTTDQPASTQIDTPPIETIEAEAMTITPKNDQIIEDDPAASQSKSVHLTSSQISLSSTNQHKADRLAIVARQEKNNLAGPVCENSQLLVSISNSEPQELTISSNIYKTYYIDTPNLDGSQHTINLRYQNPGGGLFGACQRQIWIDSINYLVTNPYTPTISTAFEKTIEAEDLEDITEEAADRTKITEDRFASQEKYVTFTANSAIEGQIELPNVNYISIRARADICDNVVPKLDVKVNGNSVLTIGLKHTGWTTYSTDFSLQGATDSSDSTDSSSLDDTSEEDQPQNQHTLTVEFINDDQETSLLCDLNAYLDYITFIRYETSQSTPNQTSLIGKTKYVAYNQLIGYVSSSRGTSAERAEYDFQSSDDQVMEDYYKLVGRVPNPSQTYLSYRIMYNNPNLTTFPQPDQPDAFINAKVDNPYIVETDDNKIAGNLKTIFEEPKSPMFFFCALRQRGDSVLCKNLPNP